MFASKGDILSLDASAPVLTRQTFTKSDFRPTKTILCCQSEPLDSHLHHGLKKNHIILVQTGVWFVSKCFCFQGQSPVCFSFLFSV